MPLAELRGLAERCDVHAFLRWSRAPYFTRSGDGSVLVADLRYARGSDPGFAGALFPRDVGDCPEHVPPWRPPRTDLLQQAFDRERRAP